MMNLLLLIKTYEKCGKHVGFTDDCRYDFVKCSSDVVMCFLDD